jgi:hypothetical protein
MIAGKEKGTAGYEVRLRVNEGGYLLVEPVDEHKVLIGRSEGSQDYTDNNSFVGYRVLLRPPDDEGSDPKGCKLINGQWYCP